MLDRMTIGCLYEETSTILPTSTSFSESASDLAEFDVC